MHIHIITLMHIHIMQVPFIATISKLLHVFIYKILAVLFGPFCIPAPKLFFF